MKKALKFAALVGRAAFIANRYADSKKVHPELNNPVVYLPHGTPCPSIMGKIPASQVKIMLEAQIVAGTRKNTSRLNHPTTASHLVYT